eukprot:4443-Heterococcus_DN1.PRE.3
MHAAAGSERVYCWQQAASRKLTTAGSYNSSCCTATVSSASSSMLVATVLWPSQKADTASLGMCPAHKTKRGLKRSRSYCSPVLSYGRLLCK